MNFWEKISHEHLLVDASLWSARFACLGDDIQRVDSFIDMYHFDASDAHFVRGLLFFPDLIAALRPLTSKPFHIHLMADNPYKLIDEFAQAGADLITIHIENTSLVPVCLQKIRALGLCAGLAFSLDSPVEEILPYMEQLDLILMMGTPLGVKGQNLSRFAYTRIRRMRALLIKHGFEELIKIEADGAIRSNTVPKLYAAGADMVVMGSMLFNSEDLHKTFTWLHNLGRSCKVVNGKN